MSIGPGKYSAKLIGKTSTINKIYKFEFSRVPRMELYGRKYQWLIMGTYNADWWMIGDPDNNCTSAELEKALEQTILTDLLPLSTSGEITVSGIVIYLN